MDKFHDGKNEHATSFTNQRMPTQLVAQQKSVRNKFHEPFQFQERKKIHLQVSRIYSVSREKENQFISSRKKKSTCNKFQKQKSARNKFQEQNQHARSSMNKIYCMRRNINIQVSLR